MPQVTAAPFPLKIGGVTYQMRPLTDEDCDAIDNWLRSTFIQMARDSMTPQMTRTEREETLAVAMREARGLTFKEGEGSRLIGRLEGVARVLWQGLTRDQPDLTFEVFKGRMFDLRHQDAAALAADVDSSLTVWKEINVGAESAQKKRTRRTREPTSQRRSA